MNYAGILESYFIIDELDYASEGVKDFFSGLLEKIMAIPEKIISLVNRAIDWIRSQKDKLVLKIKYAGKTKGNDYKQSVDLKIKNDFTGTNTDARDIGRAKKLANKYNGYLSMLSRNIQKFTSAVVKGEKGKFDLKDGPLGSIKEYNQEDIDLGVTIDVDAVKEFKTQCKEVNFKDYLDKTNLDTIEKRLYTIKRDADALARTLKRFKNHDKLYNKINKSENPDGFINKQRIRAYTRNVNVNIDKNDDELTKGAKQASGILTASSLSGIYHNAMKIQEICTILLSIIS
jgi:hypothetical protein